MIETPKYKVSQSPHLLTRKLKTPDHHHHHHCSFAHSFSSMSTEDDTVQEKKKISLKTSDDEVFDLEEDVAMEFGTVKAFFGDDGVSRDMVMPIPNVHSKELTRIIDFCTKHLALKPKAEHEEAGKKELRKFYAEYVKDETTERIMELILAADYLNVNDLLDLLNQSVADRIKNKSVEYVRKLFGIESDFTPEEEAALREEYAWAFEGVDED